MIKKNNGLIATHEHITHRFFSSDVNEQRRILEKCRTLGENGEESISHIVAVPIDFISNDDIVECESEWQRIEPGFIRRAVGTHPVWVQELTENRFQHLRELAGAGTEWADLPWESARTEPAVAIGETGLDYYRSGENKNKQKYWFQKFVELSLEKKLPLILHVRDSVDNNAEVEKQGISTDSAWMDTLQILDSYRDENHLSTEPEKTPWGVLHCCTVHTSHA
ncbi:MAG: TatD family hydrolase [Lachnospiraceae bacterium]|nr:TatD family hydrolase [Lachnospiraceae bacterium]